ncbi:MAG: 3'(2'),5'-bisphosphate nucleotidase CysQ [Candidatus Moranbacteria bacterium]|nr:3'(2'),5'-bisphosphate nucleotidase CysQ [Candidatus Moranbacteria bacterium]
MNDLNLLKKAVKEAGDAALRYYKKKEAKVEYKKDESPLTEADLASNKILCENLAGAGYPILSEENEDDLDRLKIGKVWIIDPLDGTMDFVQETGEFSVMAALAENGRPALGAVYLPATGELYWSEKGKGAFLEIGANQSEKLETTSIDDSKKARMVVSRNHLKPEDEQISQKLGINKMKKVGSNGIKIGLIAKGEAELFLNTGSGMGEWDLCAPEIILEEAGGEVTDKRGRKIQYNKNEPYLKEGIVASNGRFHESVLRELE